MGPVLVFILVFVLVLCIAKKCGWLSLKAPPETQGPQASQYPQAAEWLAGLSVKERLQLGLPIEYIGDSGQVELLDPSDAWYAVISMQLLTTRTKR